VLFAICRGLLPLLSFIAVLFVLSLPFTGLDALWRTRSATALLLTVSLLLVAFVNAVYQHDSERAPYPLWLRRLVDASLLALPVYAGLALYALGLRIAQYGWTLERFWGVLVVLLVCGYALGYAQAVLRRRGRWLQPVERVNRWMCWTVLGAALMANSPVLDGVRISVASQMARLQATAPAISTKDVLALRFELGRRGVEALRELQRDPRVSSDARAAKVVGAVLAQEARWSGNDLDDIDDGIRDLGALRRQVSVPGSLPAPDADWWQALLGRKLHTADCLELGAKCVALRRDLDADGVDDMLLCRVPERMAPSCSLHTRENGLWQDAGTLTFYRNRDGDDAKAGRDALLAGQIELSRSRWPRIALPGGSAQNVDEPARKEQP
jgi:hypothetical protein